MSGVRNPISYLDLDRANPTAVILEKTFRDAVEYKKEIDDGFDAIVLTEPTLASKSADAVLNNLAEKEQDKDSSSRSTYCCMVRILGPDSPHHLLPDPFDFYLTDDEECQKRYSNLIQMHTMLTLSKISNADRPEIGDIVRLKMAKAQRSFSTKFAKDYRGIKTKKNAASREFREKAEKLEQNSKKQFKKKKIAKKEPPQAGFGKYKPADRTPGDVKYVVLHNTDSAGSNQRQHPIEGYRKLGAGSAESLARSIGKSNRVSIHWITDGKGAVIPSLPEKDIAYQVKGGNSVSIGIEMVGYHSGLHSSCFSSSKKKRYKKCPNKSTNDIPPSKDPSRGSAGQGYGFMYTKEMVDSTAQLVADILIRWGLEPSKQTIKLHELLDPSRRSDPGYGAGNFDYDDFVSRVIKFKAINKNGTQLLSENSGAVAASEDSNVNQEGNHAERRG